MQNGTLQLDRGRGVPGLITHSKETGLNCEVSGEPVKDFDQGSNQDRSVFWEIFFLGKKMDLREQVWVQGDQLRSRGC